MNVTKVLTKDYENRTLSGCGKNKPNTKPIQTQSNPISKKAKMNVSYIITKGYENKPRFRAKAKQTQYKPKQTQPVVSLPALPALSLPKGAQSKGSNLFHPSPNTSPARSYSACFYPQNRLISQSQDNENLTELYDKEVKKGDRNGSSRFS